MRHVAIFAGLVFDENEDMVDVLHVGEEPYYVVDDAGFERHIPAELVDRHVLQAMKGQVLSQREAIVQGMMDFMRKDDLFTKAAVETSIDKMDEQVEELRRVGIPEETRAWLGLMGFRIKIDIHGTVVDLQFPGTIDPEDR